ncbi:GNAT family N-acetyltransferase [Bradyrhizobium sp. USDA 3315]
MTSEIREGDRRAAFDAALNAYGPDSLYVPPLWSDFDRMFDPAKNPFVTEGHGRYALFSAHRDGRPVGRIAASIHDASNHKHGTRHGAFGFFDCIDDVEVADALLRAAEQWLSARGMSRVTGNFNLTAMQQIGVMTDGFDHAPFTDMMWSPPHIAQHLERAGYAATFPMTTFEIALDGGKPEQLLGDKQRAVLTDPDFVWQPIKRSAFKVRLEDARLILNDGFADNPMFVPPTAAEYLFQAGDMMWIIDQRISTVVYHRGRRAGAIIAIPDLNPLIKAIDGRVGLTAPFRFVQHRIMNRRAVLIYQSVCRDLHNRGLNGAMLYRTALALQEAGYRTLGGTWIADINGPSLRQVEKVGARPLHRLHLFTKRLAAA